MTVDTSILIFVFGTLFGVIGWLIVNKVSDISTQMKEAKDAIIEIKEEMIEKHTRFDSQLERHHERIEMLEKKVLNTNS